jgi:O-antigen/teichoic acid export membrane protein
VAAWIGGIAALWLAWREAMQARMLTRLRWDAIRPGRDNPGIWTFALLSNVHSTLTALPNHLATYVVGLTLGATPAGLMKVAQEIGTGLAKPIDLLNQAIYPDVARVVANGEWGRVRRLALRAGTTAASASAMVTLALLVFGRPAITVIFGAEFTEAYWPLALVSLASTLAVFSCAVDPTLYAIGRPSRPLITALVGNFLFAATLLLALPRLGLIAGGLAYVVMGVSTLLLSAVWMRIIVPRDAE